MGTDFRPGLAAALVGVILGATCASMGTVKLMLGAAHGVELTLLCGLECCLHARS